MTTQQLIEEALARTIETVSVSGSYRTLSGKVRESVFLPNGELAIVVTDRVSVFDYKIGTIPFKGQVLNLLSAWWFRQLDEISIPHHLIAVPHPNVSLVSQAAPLPIELVVRAYLTGTTTTSSWYAYQHHGRRICGIDMPPGMRKNEPFASPLCTPTTKAAVGHDTNISHSDIVRQGLVSAAVLDAAESMAFKMFAYGQERARQRGLILVDTKYEMGMTADGSLIVIDEVHTPDSSRYWIEQSYEERRSAGAEPESLDKEFVRRMIVERGYDVTSSVDPRQFLSDAIRVEAAERYLALYQQMTGGELRPQPTTPVEIAGLLETLAARGKADA